MNRVLAFAFVCLCGTAYASEDGPPPSDGFYPLFDHPAHARDAEAVKRVRTALKVCEVGNFSRIGPSPAQMERCNKAEARVTALGPRAAQVAIDLLDDDDILQLRSRLYDIVARVGNTSHIEPLVRALEREEQAGIGNVRHDEREELARTLEQITYASVKGTPSIEWRAWAEAHRDMTRDQLLAERLAHIEEALAHGNQDERVDAAEFLAHRPTSRVRAIALLEALAKEPIESNAQKVRIRTALSRARHGRNADETLLLL